MKNKIIDPLKEKDIRARKITREYQLNTPISKDVTLIGVFNNKEYTYYPYYVGQRIQRLRKEKKVTKKKIINDWGEDITGFDISMWELGKKLPDLDNLDFLANYFFDVSLEYLLTGKDESEEEIEDDDEFIFEDEVEKDVDEQESHQSLETEEELEENEEDDTDDPLTVEEEVEAYLNGEISFNDLSTDAQVHFFEDIDGDD